MDTPGHCVDQKQCEDRSSPPPGYRQAKRQVDHPVRLAIRPLTFKKTEAIQRIPKNDRMAMTMTIKPTM